MKRPTSRVLALLELLQSGGARTATELAARLEVDERTVRRYVDHLRDLDIPVAAERGRYGGYRIERGHRLPPLMLTPAEATAVMLSLRDAASAGGDALARATAASKIRRTLPESLISALDPLLQAPGLDDVEAAPSPDATTLLTLADAAERRRVVAMTYSDREGRITHRHLAPYGLALVGRRWYVAGADGNDPDEIRVFRLDRIAAIRSTSQSFTRPEGFDAATAVRRARATAPYRHAVRLRGRGTMAELQAAFPPEIAVVDPPDADGWSRIGMRVQSLDWLPGLIARAGIPMIVDAPDALRDAVRDLGRRLISSADPAL